MWNSKTQATTAHTRKTKAIHSMVFFYFILFHFVVAWFFLIYLGFFDRIAFISSHFFSFVSSLVRLRIFIADEICFQISWTVRSKHLWEKVDIFFYSIILNSKRNIYRDHLTRVFSKEPQINNQKILFIRLNVISNK